MRWNFVKISASLLFITLISLQIQVRTLLKVKKKRGFQCFDVHFFYFFQASQASSQGVFELKLKNFINKLGKDVEGHCCDGFRTSSGQCSGICSTKFRVCLKHYQATIDPKHECTFGEHITPVLGSNNVFVRAPVITFPLDFKWPVSF